MSSADRLLLRRNSWKQNPFHTLPLGSIRETVADMAACFSFPVSLFMEPDTAPSIESKQAPGD
jgi:hypothetical protein